MRAVRIALGTIAIVLSGFVTSSAMAVANDDTATTTEGTPVTAYVQRNDVADCVPVGADHGDVFIDGATGVPHTLVTDQGTWVADGAWEGGSGPFDGGQWEGWITFTPADGFVGTTSVGYSENCYAVATNGSTPLETDSATLTVTVGPAAEIPIVSAPVAGAAAALAALIGGVWLVRRRAVA